jgi:hypothetical protein
MRNSLVCAGAVAAMLVMMPNGAQAQDGLAGMHEWTRAGGRTCMLDHFHDGSGTGASRGQAQAAAIRAWAEFTSWEYGPRWGRYGAAASKTMSSN